MEYSQGAVISTRAFDYAPGENEAEKASNGYLVSLFAIKIGLMIPLFNLLATLIFYVGNRKSSYFVRWHCTQLLFLQLSLFVINGTAFYWTLSIIFGNNNITNHYIAYLMTMLAFNILEYIITIYTAVRTRKGHHIVWWFYGSLAQQICKP
jgi:uncharacterized Tic20 family protein